MNLVRREDPDSIGTPVYGQKKTDVYGCEYIYCKAKQALVKNYPYQLVYDENGAEAMTMSDQATRKHVVIAHDLAATGAGQWCAIYGPHDVYFADTTAGTLGHGVIVHTDGTIKTNAGAEADTEIDVFATFMETKAAAAATIKCFLFGDPITWA
jgi:hypothetical protein